MITNFIEKIRSKAVKSNGFTLIEVIASIAVLSILSVALLEMFTVSTKTNVEASIMDKAKSLCIEATEEYKAYPVGPDPYDPAFVGSPYLSSFDFSYDVTSDKSTFKKYFDQGWNSTSEDQGAFILEIISKKTEIDTISTSYYPPTAVLDIGENPTVIKVKVPSTIKLNFNPADSTCRLKIGTDEYKIDSNKIIYTDSATANMAFIPIHLDCSEITSNGIMTITIENNIGQLIMSGKDYEAVADIYLCDIDNRESRDAKVMASVGVSTENRIITAPQKMTKYNADIRVIEKSSGQKIAETSVERYWVSN